MDIPSYVWISVSGILFTFLSATIFRYIILIKKDIFAIRTQRQLIARAVRAEISGVIRHCEANIIKIDSMFDAKNFGNVVDYKKFSYSKDGFSIVDVKQSYLLPENISMDISRLSLFIRNNEIHIEFLIKEIFESALNDEIKYNKLSEYKKRMIISIKHCKDFYSIITGYIEKDKNIYMKNLIWKDEIFKI
ncbi:hypothetical protein P7L75_02235 (plasmid) [Tistrella mobilis]|uniref:hypothetical protein n=1 Tax=Tistrella mobilis TaxID=171437 RepID=UPI003557FB7B